MSDEQHPMPFAGLTAIELAGDPAGEMTGLLLAQMGATVVKIEPPEGAPSRHTGPFAGDDPDPNKSLAFWYYNGGKHSVTADLATPTGKQAVLSLLDGADIVVSTLTRRQLADVGIDWNEVTESRPQLIVTSVTPFGLTGPWADYQSSDLVALAASGLLVVNGYDDHSIPPIRPGGDQAYHSAAAFAQIATQLALIQRQLTGKGDVLDVSMHESACITVEMANEYWSYPRVVIKRQTCRHAQPTPTQPILFECADGRYVVLTLILAEDKPWRALVAWMDEMGVAADLVDEAYLDFPYRQANFAHVQEMIESFLLMKSSEDAYHEGQERGLPIGIVNAPEDVLEDAHLRQRQFFVPVHYDGVGDVPLPRAPWRFSALSCADPLPAPALGADTDELLPSGKAR